ncbi:MAG TPA: hypothetical protein DCP92_12115 [Nitrospiraceae bacterium]|nr:hypothetical protein [Nitrospiraceae bacterium]
MSNQGFVSRRDVFSILIKDAVKIIAAFTKESSKADGMAASMEGFESLPIASTYPWELFEDEARRLGIDYQKLGKVEAIKRVIAHQIRQSPPDFNSDETNNKFEAILHIDPVTEIHAIFDSIFRIIIPSDSARSFFRIKGISEKLTGALGWYLWFEDRPGTYLLELIEAESPRKWATQEDDYSLESLFSGHFRIKYFPDDSDSELLEKFSLSEQIVRTSDFFDTTGTPAFGASTEMHDTLFMVGNLDVLQSPDKRFTEFFLNAPDHWVTRHPEGFEVMSESNAVILAPGENDRTAPAWQLSWWLLDRLIMLFCFVKKTAPLCAAVFEKDGKVFEIGRDRVITEKLDPTVKELNLATIFMVSDKSDEVVSDVDGCIAQLKEHRFFSGALLTDIQKGIPAIDRDWINSRWWHAHHMDVSLEDTAPC